MSIKYDLETMRIMSLFGKITRAKLKDCFSEPSGRLSFVVETGELSKALGKKAEHAKKLEKLLNRKIKILEFNSNIVQFIRNAIYPLNVANIRVEGEEVFIEDDDSKTKGLLIGRNAQNLRHLETVVKRYFSIQEIKVQ